ncbi:MAG: DUF1003 domain-containing protein [Bifidobacteriaceae bacterium]|jgi:uncharacterized membrane protein|nr:DUF1003 domain-containing protein [Bifidobacteriaceae bacterium]
MMPGRLDTPRDKGRSWFARRRDNRSNDGFGRGAEAIARFMGTPRFLVWMTLFCIAWLLWNTFLPEGWRFDDAKMGFTALTLALSLQASYAAPLILLAQNRQDDRDRVSADRDRIHAQRNLADTEYLAREVAALRIALQEVATRDFVRGELRNFLEELERVHSLRLESGEPVLEVSDAAPPAVHPAQLALPPGPSDQADGELSPPAKADQPTSGQAGSGRAESGS